MVGHQPHPQCLAPREPSARLLRPPSPQEPPARARGPPAMSTRLWPSPAGPHHAKPQVRPPIDVGRMKCHANKNNDKMYQMKQ
jgi:hypothetical protein